jgi:hypothetical protein
MAKGAISGMSRMLLVGDTLSCAGLAVVLAGGLGVISGEQVGLTIALSVPKAPAPNPRPAIAGSPCSPRFVLRCSTNPVKPYAQRRDLESEAASSNKVSMAFIPYSWRLRTPSAGAVENIVRTEQPQKESIGRIPSILLQSKSTYSSTIKRTSIRRDFRAEVVSGPWHPKVVVPLFVTARFGIRFMSVLFCAPQPGQLRHRVWISMVPWRERGSHGYHLLNGGLEGSTVTSKPFFSARSAVSQKNSHCAWFVKGEHSTSTLRYEPRKILSGDSITAFIGILPSGNRSG